MMNFICQVEAYLQTFDPQFILSHVQLDPDPRLDVSHGGRYGQGYGIHIATNLWIRMRDEVHRVYEHPSFDSDTVIGGFYTSNHLDGLKMTICHEMAHAYQHFLYDRGMPRETSHGPSFKHIYTQLRQRWVNAHLPNQRLTRHQYLTLLREVTLCEHAQP